MSWPFEVEEGMEAPPRPVRRQCGESVSDVDVCWMMLQPLLDDLWQLRVENAHDQEAEVSEPCEQKPESHDSACPAQTRRRYVACEGAERGTLDMSA